MEKKNIEKGFTLIELMVVIAIIGILSALALPRFKVFQAKAKQAEAKSNLSFIYTLEQSYQADNDTYAAIDQVGPGCENRLGGAKIGFRLDGCAKARYGYKTTEASGATFTAQAESEAGPANKIMPGCPADRWVINQHKKLEASYNSIVMCNIDDEE